MKHLPKIENWLHEQWSHIGLFSTLLLPFSGIFWVASRIKKQRNPAKQLPVPVVVVGNIYVGGTGKTPVTITLVRELQKRGWHPGIISRGFGRSEADILLVTDKSEANEVGDEPLLIYRETQAPVAVGAHRYEAGQRLLAEHPEIDVIVSDDGLQHHALARDFEIAVVGTRGLGNGLLLPAGPLREPPSRLDSVDAIVLNAPNEVIVKSRTPRYAASSTFGRCWQLSTGQSSRIDELSERIRTEHLKALAAAGIASPGRFFAMVRAHDIECQTLELGDHFNFETNPFVSRYEDIIFITGKDAVKCANIPELASDHRLWVVELDMHIDAYLIDSIEAVLKAKSTKKNSPCSHSLPN